ncbi:dus2 [Symbiodinium sp. KB8]|nr:dus2 [Symbiodinium sp. KB8]
MMEVTDVYYRYFMRLLTKRTRLYTEMVVENTIHHTDNIDWHLRFSQCEAPVALQVGGSDPDAVRTALEKVVAGGYAYDEVNLNCGCPSERVATKSCFGARLMLEAARVRDVVNSMQAGVAGSGMEVTVKCRLGADHMDSYAEFRDFIATVAQSGCTHFIVHARKCWLQGLNPKQNRTVPHLKYHWVYRAAVEFSHLRISLNGGVNTWPAIDEMLRLQPGAADGTPPLVSPLPPSVAGAYPPEGAGTAAGSDRLMRCKPSTAELAGQVVEDPVAYGQGTLWHDPTPGASSADGGGGDLSLAPGLLDSVMIGRADNPMPHRRAAVEAYVAWLEHITGPGGWAKVHSFNIMVKPIVALFAGVRGGKAYRRTLTEGARKATHSTIREVVQAALAHIPLEFQVEPPHAAAMPPPAEAEAEAVETSA